MQGGLSAVSSKNVTRKNFILFIYFFAGLGAKIAWEGTQPKEDPCVKLGEGNYNSVSTYNLSTCGEFSGFCLL